jgi:hypothetical protein
MVAPDRVTSNVLAEVIAIFNEIVHDVVPERQGLFTRQMRHRVVIDGRSVLAGEVARLGGYLARRRDGPPGWKTLWLGWLHPPNHVGGRSSGGSPPFVNMWVKGGE